MEIKYFIFAIVQVYSVTAHIEGHGAFMNKLAKVKPVGAPIAKSFVPLTELPPALTASTVHFHNGRRHLDEDCNEKPTPKEVWEEGKVKMYGDYYYDRIMKTVATVIIPDHIDYKHFQVTTPVPYLTVGPIDGIGYHPSTLKSEHPSECEKIYQDHVAEQYSDEETDYSEESLEMARLPLYPDSRPSPSQEDKLHNMYDDNM